MKIAPPHASTQQRLPREQQGIAVAGEAVRVASGGTRYLLRPVAEQEGWIVLLHETRVGRTLPGYQTRRGIVRAFARRFPKVVVGFAHLLRTLHVWAWIEPRPRGPGQYREWCVDSGVPGPELFARLDPVSRSTRAGVAPGLEREVAKRIAAALWLRLRQRGVRMTPESSLPARGRAGIATLSRLQQTIEQSDDPAVVRATWRVLQHFAVLDACCGSGDRLYAALHLLEPLYEACLERARVWIEDTTHAGAPCGRERLADLRRMVMRGELQGRRFAVASILRDNLHGIAADPGALEVCRQRLLGILGDGTDVGCTDPPLHLRRGDPEKGYSTGAEIRRGLRRAPDAAVTFRQLHEDAETVALARRIMEDSRDRYDGDVSPPSSDGCEIEARLEVLRRRLDALRAAEAGIPADDPDAVRRWAEDHRPVHLWLEFFAVVERGGFDVHLSNWRAAPESVRQEADPTGDPPSPGGPMLAREKPTPFPAPPASPPSPASEVRSTRIDATGPGYPPRGAHLLGEEAPGTLFVRGNESLLDLPLLAVFCSVRVPGNLIVRTLDAARALRDRGVATIGGFQSPLERECLRFLLRGSQPIVVSPARCVDPMRLPRDWVRALSDGRLLLVSRFDERLRRPTTRTAEARNRLVGALAAGVFIAHASPGGRLHKLARQLVEWGTPVCTWDDPANADLVRSGARAVGEVGEWLRDRESASF
jgi:hypothetical protein